MLSLPRFKLLFALLCVLLLVSGCGKPAAEPQSQLDRKATGPNIPQPTQETAAALNNVLIVTEEYPPYSYTNEAGEISGLSTAQVKRALQHLNVQVPIKSFPWARTYDMAKNDPNVLIYPLVFTEERRNKFKWIHPVTPTRTYLYCLASRKDIQVNSLDDAKKYRTGIINGYFDGEYLLTKGFEVGRHLEVSSNIEVSLEKFFNGRYDLWIADNVYADYILQKQGHSMRELREVYYIKDLDLVMYLAASPQTSDEIVDQFRRALIIDNPQ